MQLKLEMQEVLLAKEEQEELLRRRERELTALKGALKEEVAAHDQEVDKMREQYEKEISRLQTSLEEAKQVISLSLVSPPPPALPVCVPSSSFPSLSPSPITETHPVTEECGDKCRIRGGCNCVCVCFVLQVGPNVRDWGAALKCLYLHLCYKYQITKTLALKQAGCTVSRISLALDISHCIFVESIYRRRPRKRGKEAPIVFNSRC